MFYRHQFRVRASREQVARFHQQSASMSAITPPPIAVAVTRSPANLSAGDEMEFTLWLGFLPVYWLARIEAVSDSGFTDRLLRGPFAEWVHRHSFQAVDEQTTDVVDEINLQFSPHPWQRLLGVMMWLGLPALFAFRGWKTRRILEGA